MRASCRPGRLWWIAWAIATAVPAWAADDAPSLFASSEVRTVEVPSNGTAGAARLGRIDVGVLLMDRIGLDLPEVDTSLRGVRRLRRPIPNIPSGAAASTASPAVLFR